MPRWIKADLTELAGGATGSRTPFAYVTDLDNNPVPRALYRDNNSHIGELRPE